jgi:DNA-binding SARP family transcriptional activator/Tfp pilus assembly protein PilF
MIRFRVLGPVQVDHKGSPMPGVSARMVRRLLAALLSRAGESVPVDDLISALWGEASPPSARKTLQVYVRRLRFALGNEYIDFDPVGYRIHLASGELDADEFTRLVTRARSAPMQEAVELFAQALALWRGRAYEDVCEHSPPAEEARRLDEERLRIEAEYVQVLLDLGRHEETVARLLGLTAAHPYREDFRGQLMLALYRSGRQSEALELFRGTRKMLDEELGIDPGPALQRLHEAILRASPQLELRPPPEVPRQLPMDINGFVGRADHLRSLDSMVHAGASACLIVGTPGVGKTALAVHWAHRLAGHYPDGQIYLNLNGFSPSTPLQPMEALAFVLRSLGLPPEQVPFRVADAAAMFRSMLAGKRLLLILDNARTAEQVRPLLPGDHRCLVIVTSRNRLAGLVAREGAVSLELDVLAAQEAAALIGWILDRHREAVDAEALLALAKNCAYLPLALRVAAANLRHQPKRSVAQYAYELAGPHRLDALAIDEDPDLAVRNAFDLSYQDLDLELRLTFRRLGLIPGPDFTPSAVAALTTGSVDRAGCQLDRLRAAHLIQEVAHGRFALHDLLRAFAADMSAADDSDFEREDGWNGLAHWYLSRADAAACLVYNDIVRLPLSRRAEEYQFGDAAEAVEWLDHESLNIVALIHQSVALGRGRWAWELVDLLRGHFAKRFMLAEWVPAAKAGLAAARAAGDVRAQASMHLALGHANRRLDLLAAEGELREAINAARLVGWSALEASCVGNLAGLYYEMGRLDEAEPLVRRARDMAQAVGAKSTVAHATSNLGLLVGNAGRLNEAVDLLREAHRLHTEIGCVGAAATLTNLGSVLWKVGATDEAIDVFHQALLATAAKGDNQARASTLAQLALIAWERRRHEEAMEFVAEAIDTARRIGDQAGLSEALSATGHMYCEISDHERACRSFGQALDIARERGLVIPQIMALIGLAVARSGMSDHTGAIDHATEAYELSRRSGFRVLEGHALGALARTHLGAGDRLEAERLANLAIEIHRATGDRLGVRATVALCAKIGSDWPVAQGAE